MPAFLIKLQVHVACQLPEITGPDVYPLGPAARQSLDEGHLLHPPAFPDVPRHYPFQDPGRGGTGRTAERFLHLEAVILGGIVTGGDHDPAPRTPFMDRPGNRRSRRIVVGQPGHDAVARRYLHHPLGKFPRQEAPVVADHHSLPGKPLLVQIIHGGLGHQGKIVKGEVPGDDPPPPVGTELYLHAYVLHVLQLSNLSFFNKKIPRRKELFHLYQYPKKMHFVSFLGIVSAVSPAREARAEK